MAQIGTFTRGEDGTLSGTIRTLSLNVKARFIVYHVVKLDDPSFPAPIFANLVEVDGGYALVWSR